MTGIGPIEIFIVMIFLLAVIGAVVFVAIFVARSGSRQQVASPHPEGRWAADPTRRHQLRWWDGDEWTASVSDSEGPGHDPLS